MRPEDFSPGNLASIEKDGSLTIRIASMRPEDFSPGNEAINAEAGEAVVSLQ